MRKTIDQIKFTHKFGLCYTWYSPAKINLILKIGELKKNLHEIFSFFLPINMFDIIQVKQSDDFNCRYFEKSWKTHETKPIEIHDDLLLKVNKILGINPKLDIKVIKNIPREAGLGGASSNAAVYLKILSFFGYLKSNELKNNGLLLKIGSDVPFFLQKKPAIVSGCGEKIKPVDFYPDDLFFLILKPDFSFSTKLMYKKLDEKRINGKKIIIQRKRQKKILKKLLKYDYKYVAEIENDFEQVAFSFESIYQSIFDCFKHAEKVLMTGSGSSVIAVYFESGKWINDFSSIKKAGYNVFATTIMKPIY